ncbi:MAG: hypothetical protein JNL61_15540 [Rhizobiaceae bacterium]|nr:hypothetical protein [Rhizobiaceae bacterium]
MSNHEVLVVVPDAELQRSVAFALEAEGLNVVVASQLSDWNVCRALCSAACSVVDECAIAERKDDFQRLLERRLPVVLLVDAPKDVPADLELRSVVKPLLGRQLVDAVVRSLPAVGARPAIT